LLQRVHQALDDKNLFERERTCNHTRALGITLHHLGLSLRDVETVLGSIEERSHEAVRQWHNAAEHLFEVQARQRRAIAVDETVLKLGTDRFDLWAVIDVDTGEILAVALTQGRSGVDATGVLRRALPACRSEPLVLADHAPWYVVACERFGLELGQHSFGERNPVEQWFGILTQRVRRFYRRWPANASREQMGRWLRGSWRCITWRGGWP
jgi:putative transposase